MSLRLKEIHDKIKDQKRKRKDLKAIVKDSMASSVAYKDALEEVERAKEKLKRVRAAIMADLSDELQEIDKLTLSIKEDQVVLADVAISELMKGETVNIEDPDNEETLEPEFKVTFKKK